MKHSEQVLKLLRKQIGNDSEVQEIRRTAQEVVKKWINPLSGGVEETNGLVYGLVQSGKTGVLSVKEGDIRNVSPLRLRRELNLQKGELDLLAGCPPCQGFSSLRTRNGNKRNRDRRNDLVGQMLRFAKAFEPRAIMMENVPKLIQYGPFKRLCQELSDLGYDVDVQVKDAARYGVPQRRRRLILLAGKGFPIQAAAEARVVRTVRSAIGDLKEAGKSKDALHDLPEKRRSERVEQLIRDIPKDGGSRTDLSEDRQLPCHQKSDGFRDIYGRMAWDEVSPTITGGCFNPSKGRFLHPVKNRAITMREAALLQTFPKRYRFSQRAGKEAIALMIGNALPPEFIRRHALVILKTLQSG
ncbi:DNA cytosine methyltransferase [Bradyrhizobium sp. CCBAU 45389]|uniref:DNA cytosine methyltransferase n=1 Tax=Bradyrhizobium sp. CCBAU 45389 TaxID=858429 RepID=UPI00230504B4|nr:DNA cytosine methyltransferase [Bradyrhizobium sp. CCBAU 45389]